MTDAEFEQLLARLSELHQQCRPSGPWRVVEEPHDYPDGTDHFTHVHYTADVGDEALTVVIAKYVTPQLAELLVLMRNNLPEIIQRARSTI